MREEVGLDEEGPGAIVDDGWLTSRVPSGSRDGTILTMGCLNANEQSSYCVEMVLNGTRWVDEIANAILGVLDLIFSNFGRVTDCLHLTFISVP